METRVRLNPTLHQRHCWECMRRRIVCDFERPACSKCCAAGIACPGYDEKKPLKWLAPGKVSSRSRKRLTPPETNRSSTGSEEPVVSQETSPTSADNETELLELFMITPTRELKSETCTIVESVWYYNSHVYPDYSAIHELAPNPYLGHFPLEALHQVPMSMCHTLVYLVLAHRVCRVYPADNRRPLTTLRPRLYERRGLALRSLVELMGNLQNEMVIDATIGSILLFLFVDARQLPSSDWQHHFAAATELIKIRGGFASLSRSSEVLKPLILHLLLLGVMANTTTPPSQHIPTTSQLELIDLMADLYGDGMYPILLCPPYLLMDIIRINNLRFEATASPLTDSTRATAQAVLEHIEAFSAEDWKGSNPDVQEDWLLLGRMYRSSIALYCISSLQSLSIFPSTNYFTAMRTVHGTRLYTILEQVILRPRIKVFAIWPLVVAGMQAVDASPTIRHIVDAQLSEMAGMLATPAPMLASAVFRRFWTSGQTGWDECFDRPYAFVS
ncbi:Zn(II)2Cys6 transcription factor [Aspergillus alliaceus]|uniref:Zn(II)2Cys6 transcription factor n=1 Tax=Petromyces alliaceus TaxID=209559 RepID=UPI0012A6008F|nr:fungal-specific transcription factor domain-containing protein [Aspergillus alliaceus]KAB8231209.1 fungal-specific transcription factor domain-containing protein [Aspergillus alliaceus]